MTVPNIVAQKRDDPMQSDVEKSCREMAEAEGPLAEYTADIGNFIWHGSKWINLKLFHYTTTNGVLGYIGVSLSLH